jgi:nucleotide-binding universal stress UspA family protein
MTCKTIVVHLDNGERCAARVELAAAIARRHGSRLVGIAPTGVPDVIVTMHLDVADAIETVALAAATLRESAEAAARDFERRCDASQVASFESHVEIGEAVDAIVRRGRCSDLVIVGQSDVEHRVDGVADDFPQQVLLHSGAPVLVVPYACSFATIGRNVVVGWKDTREAARALRDALPLLAGAERVLLLEIGERPAPAESASSLAAAASWLASHAIAARTEHDAGPGDAGDRLLSRAADLGADLIVVGGYGHSRLREWALGGVTRQLLRQMTVPTLLSH